MSIAQTINQSLTDVMVLPVVAYTTDATYSAFIDNSVAGEVGVYLSPNGALRTNTAPLVAGDKYFIAQNIGGQVHKSPEMTYNVNDVTTQDFILAVAQVLEATVEVAATAKGETHTLLVVEKNLRLDEEARTANEFVTVTGSETTTAIATGIFNTWTSTNNIKNQKKIGNPFNYTLTNPAAGKVRLTAVDANRYFEMSFTDDAEGGTVAVITPWVKGYGAGTDIVNLEREGSIFNGYRNNTEEVFISRGKNNIFANVSSSYDQITIKSTTNERITGVSFKENEIPYSLTLAVETTTAGVSGSALYTELKAIGLV